MHAKHKPVQLEKMRNNVTNSSAFSRFVYLGQVRSEVGAAVVVLNQDVFGNETHRLQMHFFI